MDASDDWFMSVGPIPKLKQVMADAGDQFSSVAVFDYVSMISSVRILTECEAEALTLKRVEWVEEMDIYLAFFVTGEEDDLSEIMM